MPARRCRQGGSGAGKAIAMPAQAVAIAARTSVRAARRAGHSAASTPTTTIPPSEPPTTASGTVIEKIGVADDDVLHHAAEQHADADAEQAAVAGDDDALQPHRAPYQPPGRADGPEDADLPGAFQHRQRQGVDHAEDRDEHGRRRAARRRCPGPARSGSVYCGEQLLPVDDHHVGPVGERRSSAARSAAGSAPVTNTADR